MYLFNLLQKVITQSQLLVAFPVGGVPGLDSLDSLGLQLPCHFFRWRQRLLNICLYRQLQELLQVSYQKSSEVMRTTEKLSGHLEGREANLGMILI